MVSISKQNFQELDSDSVGQIKADSDFGKKIDSVEDMHNSGLYIPKGALIDH